MYILAAFRVSCRKFMQFYTAILIRSIIWALAISAALYLYDDEVSRDFLQGSFVMLFANFVAACRHFILRHKADANVLLRHCFMASIYRYFVVALLVYRILQMVLVTSILKPIMALLLEMLLQPSRIL